MAGSIIDNLKRQYRQGSTLVQLIYINVALFLLLNVVLIILTLFNIEGSAFLSFIEIPSNLHQFITHPWTLFTYMFVHLNTFHILFNMLWLYWFGQIFLTVFNEKQMVGLYLLGGMAGGLLFLLSYNLFPYFKGSESIMCGASASILAIVTATAFRLPNYRINLLLIGAVPLKYIALITIAIDLTSVTSTNSGGHIAHLGGALMGYLFLIYTEKGKDLTAPLNRLIDKIVTWRKGRHINPPKKKSGRPESDDDYRRRKKNDEDELNAILEKIKQSGYTALTTEEKRKLFEHGKNNSHT